MEAQCCSDVFEENVDEVACSQPINLNHQLIVDKNTNAVDMPGYYTNTLMNFIAHANQNEENNNLANILIFENQSQALLLSVTSVNGSVVAWPEYIQSEDHIGMVTAAVLGGVTELIVGGGRVLRGEGPGWYDGDELSRDNFDKHRVYLL